ncbi:MAG: DUF5666 domain-containing protein [Anaerolineae bacterium]|nr:DUF5666 domain-containing protein [Anaerolineae bacterium]
MYKKVLAILIITLVTAGLLAGAASAQKGLPPGGEDQPGGRPPRALGQITALGEGQLTLETPRGEVTVLVDEATNFFNTDREEITFSDLEIGRWVAGTARPNDDVTLTARLVILLPEDFDPQEFNARPVLGKIEKINPGQNQFTLITREEAEITFSVDENTRYQGTLTQLTDLEKDMVVGVIAVKSEDGSRLAKVVLSQRPGGEGQPGGRPPRALGQITALGDGQLTLETPRGEVTVLVDEATKFFNTDREEITFSDLEISRWVAGTARPDDDVTLTARLVILLPDDFDPAAAGKALGGRVEKINMGQAQFTLVNRAGEEITVRVNSDTRYLTGLSGLADLEKDMLVFVHAIQQEDGSLLAKAIATGRPGSPQDSAPGESPHPPGLQENSIKKNFDL